MDTQNYRCAWVTTDYPAWMLRGERWQALVEVEEDGRKKTRYETYEVFTGTLAYVLGGLLGDGLRKGCVAMAEGLKTRSEGRRV